MVTKLAIIIVNYKTPDLVIDCLESLKNDLMAMNVEVVVVDNHSADDSVARITSWADSKSPGLVNVISSEQNGGFSAGNNLGIKSIEAENYLLLNSDTLVREGALKVLLETIDRFDEVGAVSPRLEWPNAEPQESCFRFHSPIGEFIRTAKTGVLTKLLKNFEVARRVDDKPQHYDWVSFACILIRKEVFDDVGLLDDEFFMYFEDVDYCFRVKKAGWKILNIPSAHVVHLRGGTSPVKEKAKLRKRLPRYFYESRTRFFYKCYGHSGLFAANVMWSLGFCITMLRSLLSPSYQPDVAEKQWQDIWTNFFSPSRPYTHPENYEKA